MNGAVMTADLPVVECPPGSLVIGDLHLDPFAPGGLVKFEAWLEGLQGVPRLVVLGDLFEYWLGPEQMGLPSLRSLAKVMRKLVSAGTQIDVLHGNRDFLLDEHFEGPTGAVVHPHGLVGDHGQGRLTLFLHGDELCTLDRSYQRFKRLVRSQTCKKLVSCLPFSLQKRIATALRRSSSRSVQAKPAPTKAQQAETATGLMEAAGAENLVCGHAHEFRDQVLGGSGRWLVIDGWGGDLDALILDDQGRWLPANSGIGPVAPGPEDPGVPGPSSQDPDSGDPAPGDQGPEQQGPVGKGPVDQGPGPAAD